MVAAGHDEEEVLFYSHIRNPLLRPLFPEVFRAHLLRSLSPHIPTFYFQPASIQAPTASSYKERLCAFLWPSPSN